MAWAMAEELEPMSPAEAGESPAPADAAAAMSAGDAGEDADPHSDSEDNGYVAVALPFFFLNSTWHC